MTTFTCLADPRVAHPEDPLEWGERSLRHEPVRTIPRPLSVEPSSLTSVLDTAAITRREGRSPEERSERPDTIQANWYPIKPQCRNRTEPGQGQTRSRSWTLVFKYWTGPTPFEGDLYHQGLAKRLGI